MRLVRAHPVRWVWAFCLALGTYSHVSKVIGSGWNFPGYPPATVVFWNSLTVLDPLAAILLFVRPRLGVVVTLAIMVADVTHNVWAIAVFDAQIAPVAAQAVFLVFALATAHLLWRGPAGDPTASDRRRRGPRRRS